MVKSREEHIRILKENWKEFKVCWERDKNDIIFLLLLVFTASTPLIAVLLFISNNQPT